MKENDIELEGQCEAEDCQQHEAVDIVNKVGILDIMLSKAISRKLLVFMVATGLLIWADLDPDTWGLIAMIYVGGQSVIDTVKVWKHGGQV